jgi:hypothetical protein
VGHNNACLVLPHCPWVVATWLCAKLNPCAVYQLQQASNVSEKSVEEVSIEEIIDFSAAAAMEVGHRVRNM